MNEFSIVRDEQADEYVKRALAMGNITNLAKVHPAALVRALARALIATHAGAAVAEHLKQEAQTHAQEARTANSTIAEIYRIVSGGTGEPGNWNGAEPVRKCIEDLRAQVAALTSAPAVPEAIKWPQARDVGRIADMSPSALMRVGFDSDNDVSVGVYDENGSAVVEFCVPGSGGGKSSLTRRALIALMVAMEADNASDPDRDWWARRQLKGVQPGERGQAS